MTKKEFVICNGEIIVTVQFRLATDKLHCVRHEVA